MAHMTTRMAHHDLRILDQPATPALAHSLPAAALTQQAWQLADTGTDPAPQFVTAAQRWHSCALREHVRCLLAAATARPASPGDAATATQALLAAEKAAHDAGLTVLLGRVRRALRGYAIRRPHTDRRPGTGLTPREREILTLVGAGEPTRRIAGRLGISRETVETHVRSGMRKLGARTRTEAAAIVSATPPDTEKGS